MSIASEQVPGVYRRRVGDILVTALNDGGVVLPPEIFVGITPEDRERLLRAAGRRPPFTSAINTFLVQTPTHTVLIDAGGGTLIGPVAGKLPASMQAAGVSPGDVGAVMMTHLHIDHVGGLATEAGAPAFPNADLYVAETEIAFWQNDDAMAGAPDSAKPAFEIARRSTAPYAARTRRFAGGELLPGITAVALPGHSPGHTGYMVTCNGESLLIWGDILHLPVVQAARPDVGVTFDSDPAQAIATRHAILARAVAEDMLVTGMHMSFPGFARIARAGDAYEVQPETWDQLPA